MRINYILRNEDRILRPVTIDDAEFIVKLRNQDHAKGCINDTSLDVEKQRKWIEEYLRRENEYYWIAETLDHVPYGTTSLYHYDHNKRQIETGRWVRMANAPEINLIASRVQMNDFVFGELQMQRLVYDVVSTNKQVLRYQRMCGGKETHVDRGAIPIQGKPIDLIWFEETPESWANVRPRLCRLANIPEDRPYGSVERVVL